jgi:hypothetical protein
VGLHGKFKVQSVGINRDGAAKPPEIGRVGSSVRCLPALAHVQKILLAERRPNGERERLRIVVDGNLNVTANEKGLLVHDALVGSEVHALCKLALGDKGTPRSLDAKAEGRVGVLNFAGVAFPAHVSGRASYA